jgi:hypothetical protein
MAVDVTGIVERLAAMSAGEKALRNRLVRQGCGLREAVVLAHRMTARGARRGERAATPGTSRMILESAAVPDRKSVRKAARRAARDRVAAERAAADRALAGRMIAERLALARRFSEASAGRLLREAPNQDLAFTAASALGRRPVPVRPVAEVTVSGQELREFSPAELSLAGLAGSAGSSPFWTGQTSGNSPFWR